MVLTESEEKRVIPLHEENKLGVMPITKLIWNMSLPIIASMLVQALYNIVDSVFVSRVSEQALTAVSLAFPAQNLMIGLATGTAVGVNALMGRALGAGQRERADKVANHGILLALVGFVISALLGATCSDLFFRSQTQIENIIRMGNDYLRVVTIGSLGMFCQIMYERLLQGTGRSILSMYTHYRVLSTHTLRSKADCIDAVFQKFLHGSCALVLIMASQWTHQGFLGKQGCGLYGSCDTNTN